MVSPGVDCRGARQIDARDRSFEDFSNKGALRVDEFGDEALCKGHIRFGRLSGPGRLQRRRAEVN